MRKVEQELNQQQVPQNNQPDLEQRRKIRSE